MYNCEYYALTKYCTIYFSKNDLPLRVGARETAEPGPSDRDLTEDGTGRLGLAFNNPYLQRV